MGEVVADGRFELIGTPEDIGILRPIWTPGDPSFIRFPWPLMDALPSYPVPLTFEDLNDGSLSARPPARLTGGPPPSIGAGLAALEAWYPASGRAPVPPEPGGLLGLVRAVKDGTRPLTHLHTLDADGNEGHAVARPIEARWMIAGVFWTDGRIKIDIRLRDRPAVAREVCSAELAHAVDYGLPYTDAQKAKLMALFHPEGPDDHTWWEKQDYGAEYWSLVGEAAMALFTYAYSEMVPWQDPFVHKATKAMAPRVHQILGAPPTDGAPQPSAPVTLEGRGWVTTFGNGRVELVWRYATGKNVTVWENGVRKLTTLNDGKVLLNLKARRGTLSYQVRDADGRRSNTISVKV